MRAAAIILLLACVSSSLAADFEARPLTVPTEGKPGFTLLTPQQTGVAFTNILFDAAAEKNRILENGSGIALGDVDGDGLCDIYLCALQRPNSLFKNLGNWKFAEIPNAGGAACAGQSSTGATFADVDSDGDLDLLVNGISAGTRLFRNDGKGNFTEDTASGLERKSGATSLALADIDGDGDLDLFVVTYRSYTLRDGATPGFEAINQNGKLVVKPAEQFEVRETPAGPQIVEKGEPDFLYLNDGTGKFSAVSWTDGRFLDEDGKPLREAPRHWGLAAMFRDLNNDSAPDLYICNDFIDSPDEIWMNDGKGNFRMIPKLAIRHTSWSSMSVDVADINHDGFMDIFVADMLSPNNVRRQTQRANAELNSIRIHIGEIDNRPQNFQNTLQLNRGDGTFAEIAALAGVQATDWTWSALFLDVDLDGWDDLLVTTGNNHDIQDADTANRIAPLLAVPSTRRKPVLLEYPPLRTPRRAFRNNRDLTFVEESGAWGFDQVGISQAMATGDLDGDGDLDLVVNNLNDNVGLYRNNSASPRIATRAPVGSRIEVRNGGLIQSQEIIAGGRYLSGDDGLRIFAAPSESEITIHWRNATVSKFAKIQPNQSLTFTQPQSQILPLPAGEGRGEGALAKWFEDVSDRLNHLHVESSYDDWALQPHLPNRFSQMGPQACFVDFDKDGWEDLIIGARRNQLPAFFLNNKNGGFTKLKDQTEHALGDLEAMVPFNHFAVTAISNYEDPGVKKPSVIFYPSGETLPGQLATVGALAVGKSELFVGSRFVPGRYPESGPSRIFRYDGAHWKLDRRISEGFAGAGIVTGAQFFDYDNDGDLDLALSCDWASPKIFRNDGAAFVEVTNDLGLSRFTGRWNSIVASDFNRDGKPDLLVGNWGRNTRFQRYLAKPIKLMFGDFNGDKRLETIESFYDPELAKYVPWRGRVTLSRSIPTLHDRFPTFAAFAAAGTEELLEGIPHQTLEASTLDTMLFLNRGDRFEPAPLPMEVQFAPTMAMCVADFDSDGNLDVFLAQNFFALHDEVTRMDAGRGLLLKGNSHGDFRAIPGQESGLLIYGEQRGCAAADFNHDGKIDLVVTQNSGPTKLFLSRTGSR